MQNMQNMQKALSTPLFSLPNLDKMENDGKCMQHVEYSRKQMEELLPSNHEIS